MIWNSLNATLVVLFFGFSVGIAVAYRPVPLSVRLGKVFQLRNEEVLPLCILNSEPFGHSAKIKRRRKLDNLVD